MLGSPEAQVSVAGTKMVKTFEGVRREGEGGSEREREREGERVGGAR